MRCISPIRIKNPSRMLFIRRARPFLDVPCGRCLYCLQRRSNNFAFRINCELACSKFAPLFITLTYDENCVPIAYPIIRSFHEESDLQESDFYISRCGSTLPENRKISLSCDDCRSVLYPRDVTLFLKRLRTRLDKGIRYFACGEYGDPTNRLSVGRPHYHLIIWSHDGFIAYSDLYRAVCDSWSYGFVRIKPLVSAHVHYVSKYCVGKFFADTPFVNSRPFRCFIRCSKGLGLCYLTPQMKRYIYDHLDSITHLLVNGEKFALPRYFKDRLFNQAQKDVYNNGMLKYGIINDLEQFNRSKRYTSIGRMRNDQYSDFERKTFKKLSKRII